MDALLTYGQALSPVSLSDTNKENAFWPILSSEKQTASGKEIMFLSKENQHTFKETMSRVIDMCTDFKTRDKVLEYAEFDDIMQSFSESLPKDSTKLNQILDTFQHHVLPYSTNFGSPYSMAFPDAGNSVAAITGAVMSDFLNQNLINWRPCSPVGTVLEIIVLNWFRELIGYNVVANPKSPMEVGGFVTTGGVSSNAASLLFAREAAFPNTMRAGVATIEGKYVVLVPANIDHYSTRLASGWLGIGEQNVIRVPTKDFRYDLKALQETIDRLEMENTKIIALCCYAGDSRSMTCDDFPTLRRICDAHNIWMHVDGCHGTQLLFSKKLREKVKGIELADSITFDPHKVMCVPYVCSVIVLKDPKKLIQRPEDIITGEEHSFGQITPFFGSRAFLSLKLYFLFKHLGISQLGAMIERRHDMAVTLASKVSADPELVLVNPKVDINSVIFMYVPKALSALLQTDEDKAFDIMCELNRSIADSLMQSGEIWLHTFLIPDSSDVFKFKVGGRMLKVLRFMSGNPNITSRHLDVMLTMVKRHGKVILRDILKPKSGPRRRPNLLKMPQAPHVQTLQSPPPELSLSPIANVPCPWPVTAPAHTVPSKQHISYRNAMGEMKSDENILSVCNINTRVGQFTKQVKAFCCKEFTDQEKYVVIIYGSYAYNLAKPTSDLDIVFVAENVSDARRQRIIHFVQNLHAEFDMRRDDEIPYDCKILLSYDFLARACHGEGLQTTDSQWVIPKIEKTMEYLTSEKLLLRFFMGMLANPTLFVDGDYKSYQAFRACAINNLIRAVVVTQNLKDMAAVDMVQHFCVSKDNEFGDFYLGFSYVEPFKSHILRLLEEFLPQMGVQHEPSESGRVYKVQVLANQDADSVAL